MAPPASLARRCASDAVTPTLNLNPDLKPDPNLTLTLTRALILAQTVITPDLHVIAHHILHSGCLRKPTPHFTSPMRSFLDWVRPGRGQHYCMLQR